MGKNISEKQMQEEIGMYVKAIAEYQGRPFNVQDLTQCSVCNIMCALVFGKRFEYNDRDFTEYLEGMDEKFKAIGGIYFSQSLKWREHLIIMNILI